MPAAAPPGPTLARLHRLALARQVLAWAGLVSLGAWLGWLCADVGRFRLLAQQLLPLVPKTITPAAWHAGALVVAMLYALFGWVLYEAARLFRLIGRGDCFGLAVEHGLRRLARAALAGALGTILGKTLLGLVVSRANPPHQRQMVIAVSSEDFIALLAAILFLLLARIIAEARRVDEENRAFI